MSSIQFRFLKKMIRLIQDFYEGKVLFHSLVGWLLKDLDLAKIQDRELIRKWYDYFNPLEEADSEAWYGMKDPDFDEIKPALQKMRDFLLEQEQLLAFTGHPPAAHHKRGLIVRR